MASHEQQRAVADGVVGLLVGTSRGDHPAHVRELTERLPGLTQETCRDFTHTGYGIASVASFAETTRIQGGSPYPEIQERLRYALNLHATPNTQ